MILETKEMNQDSIFIDMKNSSLSQKIKTQSIPLGFCCAHFFVLNACFLQQVNCITKSSKKSLDYLRVPHPQVPQLQVLSWKQTWQRKYSGQWQQASVLEQSQRCMSGTFEHREIKKQQMKPSSVGTWKPKLSRHQNGQHASALSLTKPQFICWADTGNGHYPPASFPMSYMRDREFPCEAAEAAMKSE